MEKIIAMSEEEEEEEMELELDYFAGGSKGSKGSSAALKRAASKLNSLFNSGNTCYLNSVVYTLRFAPNFLHNLHHLIRDVNVVQQTIERQQMAKCGSSKTDHQTVTEKLHNLFRWQHRIERNGNPLPCSAGWMLFSIQGVNATFEGNEQQDAHELLLCLLNCIRETNNTLIRSIGECPEIIANGYIANPDELDSAKTQKRRRFLDPAASLEDRIRELKLNYFAADFEGIMVLSTKCLSCGKEAKRKQSMLDISVPVPISDHHNAHLRENPSTYIQNACLTKEYFSGKNKYRCSQCACLSDAIRSISYEVLPRLLLIQLNRFSGGMQKVSTYVPTTFTLSCFCDKCCDLGEGNKLHEYKLYSVITHVGATVSSGHYIAYTRFLDLASDYVNCPKKDHSNGNGSTSTSSSVASTSDPTAASTPTSTSSGKSSITKRKLGHGKAPSTRITNEIGRLNIDTKSCQGVNCCAMRLSVEESNSNLSSGGATAVGVAARTRSQTPRVKANNANGGTTTDPIWYECDDEHIMAMTQREFEQLLAPRRRTTITPYLLFYARFDLQPGTSSMPPPPAPPASAGQSTTWSDDNVPSGSKYKN